MNTFEITIQRKSGEGWPIVAELSRTGDFLPVRKEGVLQLDEQSLLEQSSALAYGTLLGRAVFREQICDLFRLAIAGSEEPLHVLLAIEAADIKTLRWERLCAPFDGGWDFLEQEQRTPFSLYLPSIIDRLFPAIGRRDLRALVAIACPQDLDQYGLAPFDTTSTAAGVQRALGPIANDLLAPATLDALCDRLTAEHYTLLHIVCHGKFDKKHGDTSLFLANADNRVDRVTGAELLDRLRRLPAAHERGLPHFTFLATCESALPEAEAGLGGLAQRLVRDLGMPAVLAMTDKISTVTAQALTERFYRQLHSHGEVDRALAEAMAGLAERHDITVPVICSRLGGRPLFSNLPNRRLTSAEVDYALHELAAALPLRAPILLPCFSEQEKRVRTYLEIADAALSEAVRHELAAARAEISQICQEVLELPFEALALGAVLPPYDERCPFPGLSAFQGESRAFYFGREILVHELQSRWADHNFVAVLGPSGSGKSSLVLAGLVPALQAAHPGIGIVAMKPGSDPVAQLDGALAAITDKAWSQQMLIVDQLEELFTLCTDEGRRRAFVGKLLALLQPAGARLVGAESAGEVRIVVTLRDDFWPDCAQYPQLGTLIQAHNLLIAPMNGVELRGAMEAQARAVGLRFEADLASTILEDVQDESGAMPLLQHALAELWKRRHGCWLLLKEYNAIGGVHGAIAHTADSVFTALATEQQRAQVRQIFLRLTLLSDETAQAGKRLETAQRVRFDDLVPSDGSPAETRAIVSSLANARLLVTSMNQATGKEEVEVAHEALIRHWPALHAWIDENRINNQLRQQLSQAARLWQGSGKASDYLAHRGDRLAAAERLVRRPGFTNAVETAYVDACAKQQATEHKRRLWAARVTTFAALLALATVSLVMFAGWAALRAETITNTQSETESRRLAGLSLQQLSEDPVASLELSLRALPRAGTPKPYVPEAEFALSQALHTITEMRYMTVSIPPLTEDQASLGSGSIAVGGDALYLVPYDLGAISVLTSSETLRPIAAVAWSTDGTAVLGRGAQRVDVWSNSLHYIGPESAAPIGCAEWRPGSKEIAICGGQKLRLWSYGDGTTERMHDFQRDIMAIRWSPDGRRLAAWDSADQFKGQTLLLWDSLNPQSPVTITETYTDRIVALAWAPDGKSFVAALAGGQVDIHSLEPLQPPRRIHIDAEGKRNVTGIAFVDPTQFITWAFAGARGSGDVARLWSIDGRQIRQFGASTYFVQDAHLSPDHRQLLTCLGEENQWRALLWDVRTGAQVAVFSGHSDRILAADWDKGYLATSSADGTARVWNIAACATGCAAMTLRGYVHGSMSKRRDVLGVHWRDDGQLLTWSEDGALRIWQVFDERGQPLCAGTGPDGAPTCFGFSRAFPAAAGPNAAPPIRSARWLDDDTIITTDGDSTAVRYSLSSGAQESWQDKSGDYPTVIWDPTGQLIFTYVDYADEDGPGYVWNPEIGDMPLVTVTGPIASAYWLDVGLLVSEESGAARIVAPESGKTVVALAGMTSAISAAQLHGDGRLATGEKNGTIRIWKARDGQETARFGHDGTSGSPGTPVTELLWSQDGKWIVAADRKVTLWDVQAKQEIWTSASSSPTPHVALSPDETLLAATIGEDFYVFKTATGQVRWHNMDHREPLHGIQWVTGARWAHQDRLNPLVGNLVRWSSGGPWRADGERLLLLTWGGDCTTRLWDWETNYEIMRLTESGIIDMAALSPDGNHILTGGENGLLRVWDMWLRSPESMLRLAESRSTRPLAAEQLQKFSLQP